VIPGGGSCPVGALGYVDCAAELAAQAQAADLKIDYVVHGTGSAGTQSGLVAGLTALDSDIQVYGVSVRLDAEAQVDKVHKLAAETAEIIGLQGGVPRERVVVNGDYVGPGYGLPAPGTIEAIRLAARTEALLLDPVYTGKAMAGLIDLVRQCVFTADHTVLFLHTGGGAALFGYEWAFAGSSQ
jgi:L-cysteate sulfo-lyase